jgi:hypothetical protein
MTGKVIGVSRSAHGTDVYPFELYGYVNTLIDTEREVGYEVEE